MTLEKYLCRCAEQDLWLRSKPQCVDCGDPILTDRCLPIEEDGSTGYLCPRCVCDRMIPVEEAQ